MITRTLLGCDIVLSWVQDLRRGHFFATELCTTVVLSFAFLLTIVYHRLWS